MAHVFPMQWKLAEVCQRLEHDLEILGVTAIEDHLQVNIGLCSDSLKFLGETLFLLFHVHLQHLAGWCA